MDSGFSKGDGVLLLRIFYSSRRKIEMKEMSLPRGNTNLARRLARNLGKAEV